MSPGTLGISDAEGLPKRAGVQGCGDPVPEVGDSSGAVEVVLGCVWGCVRVCVCVKKGWKSHHLLLESSNFIKRRTKRICNGITPWRIF